MLLKNLLFILLFSAGCTKKNSDKVSIFKFEDHYSIKHSLEKDNLILTISLQKGLHAYAEGEQIGKAVALNVAPDGGWEAIGAPILPAGKAKKLDGLGTSIVLENVFKISQKIKRGQHTGKALFHMQVCTETQCDRPKIHEISLASE